MTFNYIDVLLLLVILINAAFGWQRGFIFGLLDLARWIGSFLAALFFYQPLSNWTEALFGWNDSVWRDPLVFIFILVAAGFFIQFLGTLLLRRLSPETHQSRINRTLGILTGATGGVIMAAILSAMLFSMPFDVDGFQENLRDSRAANELAKVTDEIESALAPVFQEAVTQTLNKRIPTDPESKEQVALPFKVEDATPRPDLEEEMLRLVNQERAAQNLPPLAPDPELTEVARKHSADMFARGYFAHETPDGKNPFDRMREADVRFRTAGENLALAPTLQIAHTGLMNSPGHRANILRPQFGRLGIGVLDGGRRGLMISQEFRN